MMKAINYLMRSAFALGLLAVFSGTGMAADGWMTDLDKAKEKAKTDKKPVMVLFTGSDWCPPCKMMHKAVFAKDEFKKKAEKKYLLVVLDIPKKDPEMKKKNGAIMGKLGVQGVPTIILFNKDGKEFDRFTASQFPTVEKFLEHLEKAYEKKDMD